MTWGDSGAGGNWIRPVEAPSYAPAPDPAATAAAQSAANKETAVAQYGLQATNQVTPQGNLDYSQIGTWSDGTPRFQATQTYSPDQQALYDKNTATQGNLADIANSSSARIGQLLNTPLDLNSATGAKIQGLQNEFLDPQWARQEAAQKTDLINSGIRPGSEAYTNAMSDFSNNRQKAYDQSYLDSYNTGQQAALTERNQPINEISALMSGSQVQQPSYASAPTPGIAPTDVIGAQQQSLNQSNAASNAQLSSNNAFMSGLFGLGSAGLGGWMRSDQRVKTDIKKVGALHDGTNIYAYRMKSGGPMQLGVMAQEVAKTQPQNVRTDASGLMEVNYSGVAEHAREAV